MIKRRLGLVGDGCKPLNFLRFIDLYGVKTCVESRYLLCQFTLEPVSNPAIQPGSNPVLACVESRGSDYP
jgi:hypothetical protein